MIISFWSIFLLLIPLFILIWGLNFFRINIFKKVTISVVRMIIQLFLVGIYLEYIFKYDNILINFIYILVMLFIASLSAIDMVKLHYKKLLLPIFGSMFFSWIIIYTLYNYIILPQIGYFEARYMIPISGMLLGNILKGQIILLNNFFSRLRDDEDSYFYLLSMGATKLEALKGYYKVALLSSIKPDLANMATIGLVALPGMMTGQILAGASPFVAIKYQISIMISIFSIRILSIIFTIFVINRFCFDGYHRLRKDIFKKN